MSTHYSLFEDLISSGRVVGVPNSPVTSRLSHLHEGKVGLIFQSFAVLDSFGQVSVANPVHADADTVNLSCVDECSTLLGSDSGVEEELCVLDERLISLKDIVLGGTSNT